MTNSPNVIRHVTILQDEVTQYLQPAAGRRYLDVTLGGGGHSAALLARGARVLGTDADGEALTRAQLRLREHGEQFVARQAWMDEAATTATLEGFVPLDGVIADLGLSSNQLDEAVRGFSFMRPGPLDMRFDQTRGMPASAWIDASTIDDLTRVLRVYGDVDHPHRVAEAIWHARPLHSTEQLRDLLTTVVKRRNRNIHPATQVFQALRIAVNDEYERLARALPRLIAALRTGGRLAVITFHSLEDRLVKNLFRDAAFEPDMQPGFGTPSGPAASVILLTRKPVYPAAAEIAANPRARSASLRVVEKR